MIPILTRVKKHYCHIVLISFWCVLDQNPPSKKKKKKSPSGKTNKLATLLWLRIAASPVVNASLSFSAKKDGILFQYSLWVGPKIFESPQNNQQISDVTESTLFVKLSNICRRNKGMFIVLLWSSEISRTSSIHECFPIDFLKLNQVIKLDDMRVNFFGGYFLRSG